MSTGLNKHVCSSLRLSFTFCESVYFKEAKQRIIPFKTSLSIVSPCIGGMTPEWAAVCKKLTFFNNVRLVFLIVLLPDLTLHAKYSQYYFDSVI